MPTWTVQLYQQGDLLSSDLVEEAEVQPMTTHFESLGYEVRSEPSWEAVTAKGFSPVPEIVSSDEATIREAIGILESRLRNCEAFTRPSDVRQFCQLHIALETDEYGLYRRHPLQIIPETWFTVPVQKD